MTVVLDASMTINWLFKDERTPAAHEVMSGGQERRVRQA